MAQLSGLSADTIRMWERRYQTVSPARSDGGTRLYSDEDVTRLQLMRALTESGTPIGTVAGLSTEELRKRLTALAGLSAALDDARSLRSSPPRPTRIAILDTAIPEQLRTSPTDVGNLELACVAGDLPTFLEGIVRHEVDVVVMHLTMLGSQPVDALRHILEASGARLALVVYEYAPRRELARLAKSGAKLALGPLRLTALTRLVKDLLIIREADRRIEGELVVRPRRLFDGAADPPVRRFTDEQLARLRELSSSIDCECPNHLSAIVTSLVAFENYSASCKNRFPEDASLHTLLHRGTARARVAAEELLSALCQHDGIRL